MKMQGITPTSKTSCNNVKTPTTGRQTLFEIYKLQFEAASKANWNEEKKQQLW